MPARETSERIARYGQGFSKILSTLREDISNSHMHNSAMHMQHIHDKKTLHQKKGSLLNQASFDSKNMNHEGNHEGNQGS